MLDSLLRVRGGARLRDALLHQPFIARGRPRAYWFTAVPNFGDELSSAVLEWVTGSPPVWVPKRYKGKILAVGSILEGALAAGDVVWGSGLIRHEVLLPPPDVKFLAVRGPLTRERVAAEVPEIFGDPAILLPHFHNKHVERRFRVGIVPHYVDQDAIDIEDPAICVIDVCRPWREVVDSIRACETIASSSLHGLIVAEAYGVPSSWIRITGGVIGGDFKYNDYLLATGRDSTAPMDWERGLANVIAKPLPPPVFDDALLIAAFRRQYPARSIA